MDMVDVFLLVLQIMNVMWMLLSRNNNCFFNYIFYKFQEMDKLILSDRTSAPEPTATNLEINSSILEWNWC